MRNQKRNALLFTILSVFVILASGSVAFGQENKTFMWKVESQGAGVYILGSVHFLKSGNYPLNPKIETAYEQSDTLVVEADITDDKKMDAQWIAEKALYGEKDSLKNHVSEETYEFIRREADRLGLPLEMINRQKPWMLALTLSSLEIMKLAYDPRLGIDWYFLSKAARAKKVLELEGLEYQINLLSGLSPEEQELFLLLTLKDLKNAGEQVDALITAWARGDTQKVEEILMKRLKEDQRVYPFYEKFLYRRNQDMVSKIESYLKTGGTYFVVIGAAHLIGEKGIIQILKAKGHKVQQF